MIGMDSFTNKQSISNLFNIEIDSLHNIDFYQIFLMIYQYPIFIFMVDC